MSEQLLCAIIALPLLGGIFFFSGGFESWIVTHCTDCGQRAKTTPLSWVFSACRNVRRELPAGPVLFRHTKQWGVIHDVHLCEACMKKELTAHFEALFPR